MKVTWDLSEFNSRVSQLNAKVVSVATEAVGMAGDELLRLSTSEVPHDTGYLQASGKVSKKSLEAAVSYNTPYAVRVHEHPEFRFQGGRKGKYLEDPMKRNVETFRQIITKRVKAGISK
jgi:hypothetical protein